MSNLIGHVGWLDVKSARTVFPKEGLLSNSLMRLIIAIDKVREGLETEVTSNNHSCCAGFTRGCLLQHGKTIQAGNG